MARKKLFVDGEVFGQYAQQLYKLSSMEFLKETTEKALMESKAYVTEKLHQDMKKHHRTGRTEASIDDDSGVEWKGTLASIKVGFKISEGGLPSIFLMYGTPRIEPPDKKLYNDVYGAATSRKIQEIQREVFDNALRQVMEEK
jgi:hypothetical protein